MANTKGGGLFEAQIRAEVSNLGYKSLKLNPTVGTGVADILVITESGVPFCFIEAKDYEKGFDVDKYQKNKKYEDQVEFLYDHINAYLLVKDGKENNFNMAKWDYNEKKVRTFYSFDTLWEAVSCIIYASVGVAIRELAFLANDYTSEEELYVEEAEFRKDNTQA